MLFFLIGMFIFFTAAALIITIASKDAVALLLLAVPLLLSPVIWTKYLERDAEQLLNKQLPEGSEVLCSYNPGNDGLAYMFDCQETVPADGTSVTTFLDRNSTVFVLNGRIQVRYGEKSEK